MRSMCPCDRRVPNAGALVGPEGLQTSELHRCDPNLSEGAPSQIFQSIQSRHFKFNKVDTIYSNQSKPGKKVEHDRGRYQRV